MTREIRVEDIDILLLCGGRGSRLAELTERIPKPLLRVGASPFLLYLLDGLRREGFRRFFLATHYLGKSFGEFLTRYSDFLSSTTVVEEKEPLGTGGALRHAAPHIRSPFFVAMNGDSFIAQPILPVLQYHVQRENAFTMVVTRAENVVGGAADKGNLSLGPQGEIMGLSRGGMKRCWVNAGIYVLDREMVLSWPLIRFDLETELARLLAGRKNSVFLSENRLLDIGTPECYAKANQQPGFFTPKATL